MRPLFLLLLTLVLSINAHTTIHATTQKSNGIEVRIMHLYPPQGNRLMGLAIDSLDTPTIKGVEKVSLIHRGKTTNVTPAVHTFSLSNDSTSSLALVVSLYEHHELKGAGDFIVVSQHIPHLKPTGIYIQLVTKSFYNKNGFLTDWPNRVLVDMPEIIPLTNPTAFFKGDIFRAYAVDEKGEPIAHKKISIEFLNRSLTDSTLGATPLIPQEQATTIVYTDSNGVFSFIPRAKGLWSFTLVDGDSGIIINNKELHFNSLLTLEVQ